MGFREEVNLVHVVITGGKGFVGRALSRHLADRGHRVTVLTRGAPDVKIAPRNLEVVRWNPALPDPALFTGTDAVVNLAGESIALGRWSAEAKQRILSSRVDTTRALVNALQAADPRPRVLVSASAVGYYGDRGNEDLNEESGPGDDFLARVCVAWEAEARAAGGFGVRVVLARFGMVLGPGGGLLSRMITPFRLGLGGPLGSGRQWMSWVHLEDAAAAIMLALKADRLHGPINVTAPHPVRNLEFARIMGRILGRPSFLPVPAAALRLVLGEMADLLLTGQRVFPARLKALGFQHRFSNLADALKDALGKSD